MIKLLVTSAVSVFLFTGCLETKSETEAQSQPKTYPAVNATSAGLVHGTPCNNGQEGQLTYDISQSAFFACVNSQWTSVNLQGPAGPQGASGTAGAQGPSGGPGGIVLKDGSNTIGYFMGYADINISINNTTVALVMLPNKDQVLVNVATGKLAFNNWSTLYFSGVNCTGTAYAGSTFGGHALNRWYVFYDKNTDTSRYFKSVQHVTGNEVTVSTLRYSPSGVDGCDNSMGASSTAVIKVQEYQTPPPSFEHLAPLVFEPQ